MGSSVAAASVRPSGEMASAGVIGAPAGPPALGAGGPVRIGLP